MFKMTNLLHTNNKFVTIHNKCSINLTANLTALRNSCAKIACCPSQFILTFLYACSSIQNVGRNSSVGIATGYVLGGSGNRIPVGARFSAPVRTGPGSHLASCTMSTVSFPE